MERVFPLPLLDAEQSETVSITAVDF
jgi:hypothetical protein